MLSVIGNLRICWKQEGKSEKCLPTNLKIVLDNSNCRTVLFTTLGDQTWTLLTYSWGLLYRTKMCAELFNLIFIRRLQSNTNPALTVSCWQSHTSWLGKFAVQFNPEGDCHWGKKYRCYWISVLYLVPMMFLPGDLRHHLPPPSRLFTSWTIFFKAHCVQYSAPPLHCCGDIHYLMKLKL